MNAKLIKLIFATFISSILSVFSSFFLARLLSVEERGEFQLFLSLINYITIIGSGGLGFSIALSIKNKHYLNWEKYLAYSVIFSIVIALITNLIVYSNFYIILVINVIFLIISNYTLELSKIDHNLKLYQYLNIQQPLLSSLIYFVVYYLYGEQSIKLIVNIYTAIMFLQIAFCIYFLAKMDKRLKAEKLSTLDKQFVRKNWFKQNLLQVFGATSANLDKFIIASFLGNYVLGLYAIGVTFEALITRFTNMLSDYYYSGLINKLNRLKIIVILIALASFATIFIIPFIADKLVVIAFGKKYLDIAPLLVFFFINSILSGMSWILTQKMLILGKQILVITRQLVSMIIFVIAFFLFKHLEIHGVVYALLLASISRLLISIFYHYKFKLVDE